MFLIKVLFFVETTLFYWAEVPACIVHSDFPVSALSGVTPCVPAHSDTRTPLLTPAGPL